jgi:hypothetical protein
VQEWDMKKELFIHISFCLFLFFIISVIKRFTNISFWPFWVGGIFGTFLPDTDHLIYIYFLRPQELISQRVNYLVGERNLVKSLQLLYESRYERTNLVFHSIVFQSIFIVFTFLIISSSGSLFGKGIVIAFLLHIAIDEFVDFSVTGSLDNWFRQLPLKLDEKRTRIFLAVNVAILLFFCLAL